ncbi:3-keto-disaccharide hydrolase [Paraglaciecola sp.]|uniref:3-keto-disaccharide hydrolase n=1 Tax=Paraglaciecola sp. TaxID=1920173 RepID=UPI003EF36127
MKQIGLKVSSSVLVAASLLSCQSTSNGITELTDTWKPLLDNDLSQWELWMGIPHNSVKNLPEGTITANNLNKHGDPSNAMGLNNDPKNVFSIIYEDNKPVLKITGEIYGGLTTKQEFENYHLSMQVKWGEQKWAPRLKAKRDSGVLFHCKGAHGAFWKVWKACQEMQIQEKDFGDYIPLAGPSGVIKTATNTGKQTYDPNGKYLSKVTGYSHASIEPDYANGKWNQVDLLVLGDIAKFLVNGETVMVVEQSKDKQGAPLTSGQLQIQSEGAEVYYRNINIKSLTQFPN